MKGENSTSGPQPYPPYGAEITNSPISNLTLAAEESTVERVLKGVFGHLKSCGKDRWLASTIVIRRVTAACIISV